MSAKKSGWYSGHLLKLPRIYEAKRYVFEEWGPDACQNMITDREAEVEALVFVS
ncbi:hypothetical protein QRQ56_38615 [Bradyrhizobium sp. U531]|uniref:hypothetical protein n=1 Tax=Bradyrhizobium sp. U531 TaxID=3053458 RepID=UPI003F41F211